MKTVIGLEIHVELLTKSKMFCNCSTNFGGIQNSQCCPICLGMPGTLPSLNKKVIDYGIMAGLALNCNINKRSKMYRKSFFSPDSVKGYQITQYGEPLCSGGFLEIGRGNTIKKIGINRVHIEEDTGRSIFTYENETLLDYNRSGAPLVGIATEPHLNSGEETGEFLERLRDILKYIGISDTKMREGSLRYDVNINVVDTDRNISTNITELKNLNSSRAVVRAIEFEEKRHRQLIEQNKNTCRETRRWDDIENRTQIMEPKVPGSGYSYFPETDMMPIVLSEEKINEIKKSLPELPAG